MHSIFTMVLVFEDNLPIMLLQGIYNEIYVNVLFYPYQKYIHCVGTLFVC
uniref:Uncharacterized protein n=1 Tax=Arundo donax TaxID=35708 RepID=A0A0A9BHE8_ARUDO